MRLLDDSSRKPVAGAIVRLLRNDSAVAQELTSELGLALLRAERPGTYRLRIDRIGFAGFYSSSFALEAGTLFRTTVSVTSRPLTLPEVVVRSKSRCKAKATEGAVAAALWDEVQKALVANVLTLRQQSVPLLVREFEREVDRSGKVLREWVVRVALTRGQPFASLPAENLARLGFIYFANDSTVFAAPDARLLLSDAFVATHCFRAVPGERGHIGLAFDPVPNRKFPDVSGTLWVKRSTSELTDLSFKYTGLLPDLARADLGGRIEFQRLPSGNWIVSFWHVRMPLLDSAKSQLPWSTDPQRTRLLRYIDRGGRATIAHESTVVADRAIVTGSVFDGTTGHGLSGAVITVAGSADSAVTADAGVFSIALPIAGPRTVTVAHPKFALLRGASTQEVLLSLGDTSRIEFAVPPLATFVRMWCGSPGRRSGAVGIAWGADGRPYGNGELQASWRKPQGGTRTGELRTDANGGYALCDLPPNQPVAIKLVKRDRVLADTSLQLGWAEFRWVDLRPKAMFRTP